MSDTKPTVQMGQVCLDMHAALGVKWGDDPYSRITELLRAERELASARVPEGMVSEALQIAHNAIHAASKISDPWTALLMVSHALLAARGPEGMVPVPREPTDAMNNAGLAELGKPRSCIWDIYKAMLAAHEQRASDARTGENRIVAASGSATPGAAEAHQLDARRYRWIREHGAWETEAFLNGLSGEQYDAALDAAMLERP